MNNYYKYKANMVSIIFIFLGCIISAIGINCFLAHAKLLSGGVTGIALILEYSIGLPSGISVFLLNIPLLILSYKKLDKSFNIYTAIGMMSYSISLIITKPLGQLITLPNDMVILGIYGGVLTGIGSGLIFLRNGSTGGTDIITVLIRKKYSNFNIGTLGFSLNIIIVLLGAVIFGIPQALYTLISQFVQSIVLDKILKGFNSKKLLLILTEKEEEIINYIIQKLNRGVTSLIAEGEYVHKKRRMLYCIVTDRQMILLKRIIQQIDSSAFITIVDVSEVRGKGFINR